MTHGMPKAQCALALGIETRVTWLVKLPRDVGVCERAYGGGFVIELCRLFMIANLWWLLFFILNYKASEP